jgi:hypothetical protein
MRLIFRNPLELNNSLDDKHGPKIAWTPMTSVKKAEPNMTKIVIVMKSMVGPFAIDPV